MHYILLIAIYLIHSFAYIYAVSNILIMLVSATMFFIIYLNLSKKNITKGARLISLMAASIPISFRNIFGGEFSEFPLMWFYVLGALYVLFTIISLINNKSKFTINYRGLTVIFIIGISLIPLLISVDKTEALKEWLTYLFFLLLVLVSILKKNSLSAKDYNHILNFYIFGGIFAAIGVIFQYIMFTFFSITYFRIEFYGASREYFSFMFYDMSSATVYLATIVFLLLFVCKKRKTISMIFAFLIMVAMAISSARAGLAALFMGIILYTLFKRGFIKKIGLFVSVAFFAAVSLYILNDVRGLGSATSYITYDAGRIKGYIEGLKYFYSSPIFGVGYDLGSQMKKAGLVVPHFAFINLLAQTGIIITIFISNLIFWIYRETTRKSLVNLKWIILISLIGSCIIPGFFNSRFFTIIAMLAILKKPDDVEKVIY